MHENKLVRRMLYLGKMKNSLESKKNLLERECMRVYLPIIGHLRLEEFQWKLEDYYFYYLYPTEYKQVDQLLCERQRDREKYILEFVNKLRKSIQANGVKVKIYGRSKHIYSIWRKMQKKNMAFDRLFDIRAVRIIAECLQDCYAVLDIVHSHFCHLPNEFNDYITNPKPNGYQSIHTVVFGPERKTIEIQIRSKKMHEDAELGIAAHWKYKKSEEEICIPNIKVHPSSS